MKRIYNFSPGPAVLPIPVLEEASKAILEIADSGMGVLELSHRGKIYEAIHLEARAKCLELMGLSKDEYTVVFMGGGASTQSAVVPMNFLPAGKTADYVNGGEWGIKAIKEAKGLGTVNVAATSEGTKHSALPRDFKWTPGAAYAHLTTNNTIEGTQMRFIPDTGGIPIVLDASSDFLGHKMDWSKASLIYAGAQKNAGPAGVTIIVIKKSFLATAKTDIPAIFQYAVHDKADSLYNTPPAFPIYVFGLVLKWIEKQGGVAAIEKANEAKAKIVYDAIDSLPDFYEAAVTKKEDRSWMNITWRVKDASKEEDFLKGAKAKGMDGLKGHRNVGGFRASIYNAFPKEGCEALAAYLKEFSRK